MKIQIIGSKVYLRQNIAGLCQQPFCFQKFVDNAQQYSALTPQPNFRTHNLIFFSEGEGDGIKTRLPFRIFSTLYDYNKNNGRLFF